MSEERLSKLQKWILKSIYLINPEGRVRVKDLKKTSLLGLKELWGKQEIEKPFNSEKKTWASIDVVFSRSLRSLERKDLIFAYASDPLKEVCGLNISDDIANLSSIALNDKGEDKAKELLNVKNPELNNKKGRCQVARKTLWEGLKKADALIGKIKSGESLGKVDMESLVDKQMVKKSLDRINKVREVEEYDIAVDEAISLLAKLDEPLGEV